MNWMPREVIWKSNTVNSAVERNPARRAEVTLLDLFAINCMGWGFLLGIRELGCGRPSSKPQKLIFRQVWNIKEIVYKICRKENPDERRGGGWNYERYCQQVAFYFESQTYRLSPSTIIVHCKMLETLYEQFDPWLRNLAGNCPPSIKYAQPQSIKYTLCATSKYKVCTTASSIKYEQHHPSIKYAQHHPRMHNIGLSRVKWRIGILTLKLYIVWYWHHRIS